MGVRLQQCFPWGPSSTAYNLAYYKVIQKSRTTIVVHSKDAEEVGMAHEAKSPKKPASIFPDDDGVVLVR